MFAPTRQPGARAEPSQPASLPAPPSSADTWPRTAPELFGVHPLLDTPGGEPLTLGGLSGCAVPIEFWSLSCGNCQRMLPFLRHMHGLCRPGLVVVAVDTPELPFERPARNFECAARKQALSFPIGLDYDYAPRNAFGDRYWPSYPIDAAGHVRYAHVGEGGSRQSIATMVAPLTEAERASNPAEPNPQPVRSD
jgi:thiol-disulfide isomerase/thioredoxin